MSKLKFMYTAYAIATALTLTATPMQASTNEEAIAILEKHPTCDGSQKAQRHCEKYCIGNSILEERGCSNQIIWDHCSRVCRQDWIEDCIITAKEHKLVGDATCK